MNAKFTGICHITACEWLPERSVDSSIICGGVGDRGPRVFIATATYEMEASVDHKAPKHRSKETKSPTGGG